MKKTVDKNRNEKLMKPIIIIAALIFILSVSVFAWAMPRPDGPDAVSSATMPVNNTGQYQNEGSGKVLIILFSGNEGNTRKVADAIATEINAAIYEPGETLSMPEDIDKYEIIGFGSGIFRGKHHQLLLDFAEKLPDMSDKHAFIFSTNGAPASLSAGETKENDYMINNHQPLRRILTGKGMVISGEFSCPGLNKNSFLKIFGGLNKNRPNDGDLKNAAAFARGLLSKT